MLYSQAVLLAKRSDSSAMRPNPPASSVSAVRSHVVVIKSIINGGHLRKVP